MKVSDLKFKTVKSLEEMSIDSKFQLLMINLDLQGVVELTPEEEQDVKQQQQYLILLDEVLGKK